MIINTLPCNSLQCRCQGSWLAWLPACLIMLQWIGACRSFCQMPLWSWNLIIFGLEEVKLIWNLESRHLTSLRLWNHSSPIAPTLVTTPQFVSIICINPVANQTWWIGHQLSTICIELKKILEPKLPREQISLYFWLDFPFFYTKLQDQSSTQREIGMRLVEQPDH